jgi:hypothetical protein
VIVQPGVVSQFVLYICVLHTGASADDQMIQLPLPPDIKSPTDAAESVATPHIVRGSYLVPRDKQRWTREEAVKTLISGLVTITEFRTTTVEGVCTSVTVAAPVAAMVIMRGDDEAVVPHGLIFDVEPIATDNQIEWVQRQRESARLSECGATLG